MAAGDDDAYAIGSDGNLYAWGYNGFGQLGDGTASNNVDKPERITLEAGVQPVAIAAGTNTAYAIGSDGNLYAWGENLYGALEAGTNGSVASPERITLPGGASPTAISAGAHWEGYAIAGEPPPTTSVLVPANGATVSGTAATLDASASNATSVEFWLFGGSYGYTGKMIGTATSTAYGWIYSWNTTTVPDDSYALLSEAFNASASAFSAGVSITVKN